MSEYEDTPTPLGEMKDGQEMRLENGAEGGMKTYEVGETVRIIESTSHDWDDMQRVGECGKVTWIDPPETATRYGVLLGVTFGEGRTVAYWSECDIWPAPARSLTTRFTASNGWTVVTNTVGIVEKILDDGQIASSIDLMLYPEESRAIAEYVANLDKEGE